MSMKVIDVSKHQKSFSATVAKNAGIEAVFIRVAYAEGKDTLAVSWARDILENGLPLGGYGFATWHYKELNGGSVSVARILMQQQVRAWIQYAREAGVNWYLAIDQELETKPKEYHMGLSMDDNTQLLNEAAAMIRTAGFTPLMYCAIAWDYANISTAKLDPKLNYWFAWYVKACDCKDFNQVSAADIPNNYLGAWWKKCYQSGRLAGWQYDSTSFAKKYGASGDDIDRDWFYQEAPHKGETVLPDVVEEDFTATDGLYTITVTASKGDKDKVVDLCIAGDIPYKVTK